MQFFANLSSSEPWAYIKPFGNISIDRLKRVVSYQGTATSKWVQVGRILGLVGVIHQAGVNLIVTDVDVFKVARETTSSNMAPPRFLPAAGSSDV